MMATLAQAIEIATRAHAGQVDKAGAPYIEHPLRVMRSLESERDKISAMLHDVIEDTSVTLQDLAAQGFEQDIIDAVDALTKRRGETRMQAAARAAVNPIARRVKLADNADNMDLSRIKNPTEKDLARMVEYRAVRELLLAADR
jgi:GTP diphosphokinase / guanosine-3',5'-bis(diphosphate) 3'-diphosphatase